MKALRYFLAWLMMPILAVRHKIKGVTHYSIVTDRFKDIQLPDYIQVTGAFDAILETDGYGDCIELFEHYKKGDPKRIQRLKW